MAAIQPPIRNLAFLSGGTACGYGISILILPLLTRLYRPEQFGELALLFGLTQVCGIVGTGHLEKAIFLTKNDLEVRNLALSAFTSSWLLALMIALPLVIFLQAQEPLHLLPLTVLFQSVILIECAEGNFRHLYSRSGIARGLQGALPGLVSLGLAFTSYSAYGLVYGFALSQIGVGLYLIFTGRRLFIGNAWRKKAALFATLRNYRAFPCFTLPHEISGAVSAQAASLLIPIFYGSALAGTFFIAQKCVMLPSVLLGGSTAQVYFHELSKVRDTRVKRIRLFKNTIFPAALSSLLLFGAVYTLAPSLLHLLLGPTWDSAGDYCRMLAPWAAIHLVGSILSQTPLALHGQRTAMLLELCNAFLRIALLSVGFLLGNGPFGITLFLASSIIFSGGRIIWYSRLVHTQ